MIQISRIQHRRGLLNELPEALSEGEFGLTLDTGEVFIGAPNYPPIANRTTFPNQNIQLLTEFSLENLTSTSLTYAYKYKDPDHALFPGSASDRASASLTSNRLLQERLDEIVSVKSYGAKGDGITDDTVAIRDAASDLYDPTIGIFRRLYFPAGTYLVTSPVKLYPKTAWFGDGIEKSIITLSPTFVQSGNLDPGADPLPTSPDNGALYTIINNSGNFGGDLGFTANPGDQIYFTTVDGWKLLTAAFGCVAETVNSDGKSGSEINDFIDNVLTTNALPEDINVAGISFHRSTKGDVLRLNRTSRAYFDNCRFQAGLDPLTDNFLVHGDFTSSTIYDQSSHGLCVRIDSLSLLVSEILGSKDFVFDSCEFLNNTYGFYITDDIENVVVLGGRFENLFKGVSLGEGAIPDFKNDVGELSVPSPYIVTDNFGPKNFRVVGSRFNNIMDTAFAVYSTNGGNTSGYNQYSNYGQGVPNTPITPIAPGILFYADVTKSAFTNNNVSVGDVFDYSGNTLPDDTALRVRNVASRNIIISPQDHSHFKQGIEMGHSQTYLPQEPITNRLAANEISFPTGIIFNNTTPQHAKSIVIEYSIDRGEGKRVGTLYVNTDGLDVDYWESYTDIGDDILIEFEVSNTESQKTRVKFTDLATGPDTNFGADAYLRWHAHYWDHSYIAEGSVLAIDDEIDITGISGSEDWGLITEGVTLFDDYGNVIDVVASSEDYGFTG